jgi:hypothetical protein
MNSDPKKDLHNPPALRDFELDAEELGPATRLMCIEADPEGGIFYQFGRRPPRCLQLPSSFGLHIFGMIDQLNLANFIDLESHRLVAIAAYGGAETRIVLFGDDWGAWYGDDGRRHAARDITPLLRQWRVPIEIQEFKQHITVTFTINIYARQLFHSDARCFFNESRDLRHSLNLVFSYPSGEFVTSRLVIHEITTGKLRYIFDLDRFPILWPERKVSIADETGAKPPRPAKPDTRHRPSEKPDARPEDAPHASKPADAAPADAKPVPPPADPDRANGDQKPRGRRTEPIPENNRRQVVPETTHLSVHDLIAMLSTESAAERRWLMIEPNLSMGRPARTYALISNYPDLISERVREWSPVRLKTVFADQPGAVMIGLMLQWKVNQILAIADANAESDRILDWLREREIDRLMNQAIHREVLSVTVARRILNIDANVDAAVIKKVWRTLLGFINVDHGRASEQAIHRKKDEIAKHLHEARDLLIQKLG